MKTLSINNVDFELHTSRMYPVAPIRGCKTSEIFDVYDRPSIIKVSIWEDWCIWCNEVNAEGIACGIQIASYNCNFFTIRGSICIDGNCYDLCITRSHNRIYQHQPL